MVGLIQGRYQSPDSIENANQCADVVQRSFRLRCTWVNQTPCAHWEWQIESTFCAKVESDAVNLKWPYRCRNHKLDDATESHRLLRTPAITSALEMARFWKVLKPSDGCCKRLILLPRKEINDSSQPQPPQPKNKLLPLSPQLRQKWIWRRDRHIFASCNLVAQQQHTALYRSGNYLAGSLRMEFNSHQ